MSEEEIIKDLIKYISFANKSENFSNDNDFKWNTELSQRIQGLLDLYNKEKEKNFKRSDMIFCLKAENTKLKDRIQALENADLTSVYIDGVYDAEKKLKDKIRKKIKELEKEYKEYENSPEWEIYDETKYAYELLQELLEEEK